jgi:hypothetical protein
VRRTAAGEAMRAICRGPQMPNISTVMIWMARRPTFRAAIEASRLAAGRSFVGRNSSYCRETAEIIFQRLCAGEGLVRMCREDSTLPSSSTVYRWMAEIEEFRAAVGLAREIAAEMYFEKGWELAEGAMPETAYLTDVKLKHLRWHAGKLSPRKYGTLRPQDPPPPADDDDRNNLTVVVKKYGWDGEPVEGPDAREQVLYRMKIPPRTPAQRRAEQAEEAEEERAERAAAEARAAPPEKPWDPEGWT